MDLKIKNRHALLTGASDGLGLTGYVKALGCAVARNIVTVNSILPDNFISETPMTNVARQMAEQCLSKNEIESRRTVAPPAGRFLPA